MSSSESKPETPTEEVVAVKIEEEEKPKKTRKRKSPTEKKTDLTFKEKQEQQVILQNKIRDSTLPRFVKWLKKFKDIDLTGIVSEFKHFQEEELIRVGLKAPIPFGRYKGESYDSVYKTIKGRKYLEWAVQQEWCFEDTIQTVRMLADYYDTPAEDSGAKKAKKTKKKKK